MTASDDDLVVYVQRECKGRDEIKTKTESLAWAEEEEEGGGLSSKAGGVVVLSAQGEIAVRPTAVSEGGAG